MRVYWWESGGWQDYEWYTPHRSGTLYQGYEGLDSLYRWLNMDYPLLSGHLLVADDWSGIPWMVQLMYDRFGVYVGQRFYPAKVKRKPHYLKQYPDEPPPIYLPGIPPEDITKCLKKCIGKSGQELLVCVTKCIGIKWGQEFCEENYCIYFPDAAECVKGNPCKIKNPDVADCQNCCNIKYYCCLIFNPPGTYGAARCYWDAEACLLKCMQPRHAL